MSTVMTPTDAPNDSAQASNTPHHRRSREEVEALAKNFVATPPENAAPAKPSRTMLMAGVGGAVVLAGVVVAYFALSSPDKAARPAAENNRAVAEVEELRQRMEAERERQRKELAAGQEYLERIAASDAAVLKDMTAQADRLADRVEKASAAPARAEGVPTPRDETRTASAPAKPAPTTTASAAPATTSAAPQKAAAAPQQAAQPPPAATQAAPAQSKPTVVAQAAKAQCAIHVSELSSSGTLTYESIKKVKGVRIDDFTGHVFTPPVMTGAGRKVVFEVLPDGCVRVARR